MLRWSEGEKGSAEDTGTGWEEGGGRESTGQRSSWRCSMMLYVLTLTIALRKPAMREKRPVRARPMAMRARIVRCRSGRRSEKCRKKCAEVASVEGVQKRVKNGRNESARRFDMWQGRS